jgi:Glycosyltransferase family 20
VAAGLGLLATAVVQGFLRGWQRSVEAQIEEFGTRSANAKSEDTVFNREIQTLLNELNVEPLHRGHHSPDEVYELFRAADACIVSSLHDGMNLVAKEFVASRDDEQGVLILSSFAGASRELSEALIVNPYDSAAMATALERALLMPLQEQRDRMRLMRELIRESISLGGPDADGRLEAAQAPAHPGEAKGARAARHRDRAHSPARLGVDHHLEPAIDHALQVEWHALHKHAGDPFVLHNLLVDAVPMRPRLVDDPRKEHRFVGF